MPRSTRASKRKRQTDAPEAPPASAADTIADAGSATPSDPKRLRVDGIDPQDVASTAATATAAGLATAVAAKPTLRSEDSASAAAPTVTHAAEAAPAPSASTAEVGEPIAGPADDSAGGGAAATIASDDLEDDDGGPVVEMDKKYMSRNCPYLDTINRNLLDFDFEKLCSVSMSNQNVYACLVTGKYFQGRGTGTHAYTHALMTGNHVFLNLHTLKFYCLPDNYEIVDPSLDDILAYLKPTFSPEVIDRVENGMERSRALDGRTYLPGIVGLNNIKANDYVNVVVQMLCRVTPFRNFFLVEKNYAGVKDPLVTTFGELMRKICNPRNFKSHVSPHEFLQAVVNASKRRFKLTEQRDPFDFLSWLLNALHMRLKTVHKKTVVHKVFRGLLEISTRKLPPTEKDEIDFDFDSPEYAEKTSASPFLILPLDVPAAPLFNEESNIIPQVPLYEIFNKFDGVTEKEYKTHQDLFVKKFQITKLPEYLIVQIKRFTKNTFFTEKNPTVVNFPVRHLMLKDFVPPSDDDDSLYKYNLIANVVHDGLPEPGKGTYSAHVLHQGTNQWFDTQDLHVDEVLPQMITLSTSYLQIWERQPDTAEELEAMKLAREEAKQADAEAEAAAAAPMELSIAP
mmetsp:Transcript_29960/g.89642  ORF Transcript_29960/g.89642 Transcript_29960/m.89642 type:complete len:626 (+) Transcript_29960:153-2030(+)|eukprot:CAMPEP_0206290210 /NCGR_PEP_ID=MMETSP0106_2-20121207/2505_1 /ASSEMBLY_ACC=CAM_ASM_000206 /TAXON_ID=81532 /ORGANISM="Acanthoeca-like sp., Strain 10tr" /LENGTH=625 /DNA_ID=CAMNT_0053720769 /DNA_START=106 /DNA_END=1983 /DNA_ORIENTATION=+